MIIFPIVIIIFFTSLMHQGVPIEMPVGVVDLDNTSTTRQLTQRLDAFQTSNVVARYPNMNEARRAIQQNKIYAFILFPKDFTSDLMASKQPTISFYYSSVALVAGSNLFRDLKVISSLAAAAAGSSKLSALGKTSNEIKTFLQPIVIDMHLINNPTVNYNVYLSTFLIPAILVLFVFLLTPYAIGTELKFKRSREWMQMAGGNIHIALIGKLLPQTIIYLIIFFGFEYYLYYVLNFPHPGGFWTILISGILVMAAGQSFGVFIYGLMPSLRMSMSICTLWSVVSFSVGGATFPIETMDPMIQAMAQLFPMRHYCVLYQTCIFNGYPLSYCWINIVALLIFCMLPAFTIKNIRKAMLEFVYIP